MFAPNVSRSSVTNRAAPEGSIADSITIIARSLGPNAPRQAPLGSSARVGARQSGQRTFNS
jgi:hypothetical protein